MAKRNTRSRQQVAQRALTRLLLAQVTEMISCPGPLAAALQSRFASTTAVRESRDAVEHATAGCKGTWVKSTPLSAAAERWVCSDCGVVAGPSSKPLFKPWLGPKSARCVAVKDLLAQEVSRDGGELSAAYAQAAWQPSRELQRDLIQAGRLVARVFGESVGPYEPVGFLDGESEPQTLDEAFVLLRRLAERSGLSPMGVLKAFVAGNLAATSLGDAFPGLCRMQAADIGRVAVEWADLGSTTESLRHCGPQGPVPGSSGCSCLCKACQASGGVSGFRGAGQ